MSRIITQQLTRHRNAITQESQRYVDYSGAPFNDPADFKDKYDKDKIYAIDWFNEENQKLTIKATSANIGKMINSIYGQLRDQGMDKEDARAYLTNNTQCGKIYITFTFRKLIKFLELRVDPSAQAEIHKVYAIPIERMFKELVLTYLGDIYKYLLPKYMLTETDGDYSEIDEILEEVEEEI
jgi:flavin-dependent thymidylate synthase